MKCCFSCKFFFLAALAHGTQTVPKPPQNRYKYRYRYRSQVYLYPPSIGTGTTWGVLIPYLPPSFGTGTPPLQDCLSPPLKVQVHLQIFSGFLVVHIYPPGLCIYLSV